MSLILDNSIKSIVCGISGEVIKKVVRKSDGVALWVAGNTVTYYVDSNTKYSEFVDNGASALTPSLFTPSKSGWTFVGWREDTTASGSVLNSKVMDSEPITLYAVFTQDITLTYYNASTTPIKLPKPRYYNNGSYENPTFTVAQNAMDGWRARGWSTGTTANASVTYSTIKDLELTASVTLYGLYQHTVGAAFYSGWAKANSEPVYGTRYYNSAGNTQNATITAPAIASISGWTIRGWSANAKTEANASVMYTAGNSITIENSKTYYALYQKTITAHFISGIGGTNTQDVPGTSYYNSAGNVSTIDITAPTGATASGWTWRGWSKYWDQAAAASVYLKNGGTTNINHENDGITYYGLYQQTITEKFIDYDGSKNNENPQYATTYYNSAGNTSYSNITVPNAAEWSGMTFEGWSYPGSNSFDVNVTKDQVLQSTADCTRYAIYTKTVYLYYNGNGASSGSVTTQSGTVRCNVVGNWSYPSFRLAENGFTKSGYTFNGWNLGAVGASITLSANATAYAQWVGTPYYPTFADSSLWTKVGTVDNAATPFKAYDSSVEVCAQDNGQMTDFSYSTYQATFNTQGCNKVRLYVKEESGDRGVGSGEVRVISNSGTISQGITTEGKHYLYFDMSGDTFTVQLSVGNASTYYSISVYLYEIYAYCE